MVSEILIHWYIVRRGAGEPACPVMDALIVQNQQTDGVRMMLKNRHLQSHRPAHSPSRSGLAILAAVAFACTLLAGPLLSCVRF